MLPQQICKKKLNIYFVAQFAAREIQLQLRFNKVIDLNENKLIS